MSINIKSEIRVIGFDDCPFVFGQKETIVIGAVYRGGQYLDGLVSTKIKVDGMDSTEKIAEAVISSKHHKQLQLIMLNGITFGGFNVVDIKQLSKKTGLPVIAVVRHRPDLISIKKAIKKLGDFKKRLNLIKNAGNIKKTLVSNNSTKRTVYFQLAGIEEENAEKLIKLTATRSIEPEPLRAAHIICTGMKPITYEK